MKTIRILFNSGCLVLLYSCSAVKYAYTPATANLLQVDGKNDVKVAVNYANASSPSLGEKQSSNGIDVQTAFAVNNKIVVKADGYFKGEKNQSAGTQNGVPNEKIKYKKYGIEISAGCYNFSTLKKRTSFQAFAGIGTGRFSFIGKYADGSPGYFHSMNYFKVFIQPSYTFFISKNYEISFAGKLNMLQFVKVKTDYPNLFNEPLGYINTKPNFFIDFVIHNQFSFNKLDALKFQMQIGFTGLATKFSSVQNNFEKEKYNYNNSWLAIGVIVNVKEILKKN